MSQPSRPPSAPAPVELEPVTCWPLIIGAIGFVCLGLFTVGGFAAWTALFPPPKAVAVVAAPSPRVAPARTEPVDLPPPPIAAHENERQVKVRREVIENYRPMPPVTKPPIVHLIPPPRRARLVTYQPPRDAIPTSQGLPDRSEMDLIQMLWKETQEIDLETEKGTGKKLLDNGKKTLETHRGADGKALPPFTKNIRDLLNRRDDLRGLPLQDEKDCQSPTESTRALAEVSLRVRALQARTVSREDLMTPAAFSDPPAKYEPMVNTDLVRFLKETAKKNRTRPAIVRPLEQMIQIDGIVVRRELIDTLAAIDGGEATQAIARRAVFDISPEVRVAAVKALEKRPLEDARPVFLAALRHPWAPAAVHAARALSDLNDQKAYDSIKKMIDAPDPCLPFSEGKNWYAREVVRVNHLRNCLLCHAVSLGRDPVTAPIPIPGEPLPRVYYSRKSRSDSVRADIVYFRQEFSVMQLVAKPDAWPAHQRFDYLVRKRKLTSKELEKLPESAAKDNPAGRESYPQRDAVLYTLYRLAFAKGKADKPSK